MSLAASPRSTDHHGPTIGLSLAYTGYAKGQSIAGAPSAHPQAEEEEQGEEIKLCAFSKTEGFPDMEAIDGALATHTAVASSADADSHPR